MPIKQECKKEYYPLSFALPFLLKQNLFERENLGPLIKIPFAPRTVGSFLNSDDRSISSLLRTTCSIRSISWPPRGGAGLKMRILSCLGNMRQ